MYILYEFGRQFIEYSVHTLYSIKYILSIALFKHNLSLLTGYRAGLAGHPGVSATQPQKSPEIVPVAHTFQWAQEVVATKKVPQKSPIIPKKRHIFLQ